MGEPIDAHHAPSAPVELGHWMEQDHERLDELWERAAELATTEPARAATTFELFRAGLLEHIRVEEELLFPHHETIEGAAGIALTQRLRDEHLEIRAALARLARAYASYPADRPVAELTLQDLLYSHNAREENGLYPWLDARADEPATVEIAADAVRQLSHDTSGPDPPSDPAGQRRRG